MKKSRIIIPALAMIAFSMAASISGAVAWFTASRTAEIDAGTYAVVKTSSNLAVSLSDTGAIGASVTTDSGTSHIIGVNGKLTDASFDHKTSEIYEPDNTGTLVGTKTALASANATNMLRGNTPDDPETTTVDESEPIYSVVTWDMTFSVSFGSASGNIGLFLDLSKSNFTPGSGNVETGDADTSKGFRMAFVPQGTNSSSGNTRVFADLELASVCKYIHNGVVADPTANPAVAASTLASVATSYVSTDYDLIDSSSNAGLASSYTASAAASMPNFFGTFAYSDEGPVELSYKVVCWFEGTDPNIVDSVADHNVVFRDVVAHLAFEAINLG